MADLVQIVKEVKKEFPPFLDYIGSSPKDILRIESERRQAFVNECMRRYCEQERHESSNKDYLRRFCAYVGHFIRTP